MVDLRYPFGGQSLSGVVSPRSHRENGKISACILVCKVRAVPGGNSPGANSVAAALLSLPNSLQAPYIIIVYRYHRYASMQDTFEGTNVLVFFVFIPQNVIENSKWVLPSRKSSIKD